MRRPGARDGMRSRGPGGRGKLVGLVTRPPHCRHWPRARRHLSRTSGFGPSAWWNAAPSACGVVVATAGRVDDHEPWSRAGTTVAAGGARRATGRAGPTGGRRAGRVYDVGPKPGRVRRLSAFRPPHAARLVAGPARTGTAHHADRVSLPSPLRMV